MKNKKIKITSLLDNRQLFELRYLEIQLRERERKARIERQLLEAKLQEEARKAKKILKKVEFNAKNLYVQGGHLKNEVIGMLTVFSFNKYTHLKIERDIKYDPTDKRMYLNTYQRKDRDMSVKAKVVVYIHGGGWIGGFPEARGAIASRIAEQGYFVINIYYGEAPEYAHPKMIEKVYKAFAWLINNKDKYNIDTESIFVTGESAGAHLSAMAGAISTNEEYKAKFDLDPISKDIKIAGLVLDCGVYDLEKLAKIDFRNVEIYTQSYCGGTKVEDLNDDAKKEISPIYWVNENFPPTFAISGDNDKLAVLTFDMVKKLFDLGVKVKHYHAPGKLAVHAFAVSQILKISKVALRQSIEFLKEL